MRTIETPVMPTTWGAPSNTWIAGRRRSRAFGVTVALDATGVPGVAGATGPVFRASLLVVKIFDPNTNGVIARLARAPAEMCVKVTRISVPSLAFQPRRATNLGQRVAEQCLSNSATLSIWQNVQVVDEMVRKPNSDKPYYPSA
jgi:hypothetical protein